MPATIENLGENSFAAIIRRAEARAGSRAALVRLTGISEQNLRRWGDHGEFPKLSTIQVARRDLPLQMLIEIVSWVCDGTRVCVSVADGELTPLTTDQLRTAAIDLPDAALRVTKSIDAALADGFVDRAEHSEICSGIGALNDKQLRVLRSLSCDAMTAANRGLRARHR